MELYDLHELHQYLVENRDTIGVVAYGVTGILLTASTAFLGYVSYLYFKTNNESNQKKEQSDLEKKVNENVVKPL